jgi:hypothetical protein
MLQQVDEEVLVAELVLEAVEHNVHHPVRVQVELA